MDLLSLPGHTLRLYLHLLARGHRISLDAASCRSLSRQSGVDRRTIPASLARLQETGLIHLQEQGCTVDPAPLAALLAGQGGTSMRQSGVANCLPHDQGGTFMCHPGDGAGTSMDQGGTFMLHPAGPSTPARTSWPSLQEGSSCTTPPSVPPMPTSASRPGGPRQAADQTDPTGQGQGGPPTKSEIRTTVEETGTADPWLVAMRELWQRIAPGHPHDPDWWLGYLHRNCGAEIPLAVFTQFAEGGHTLARLEHPQFYRAWFETQCSERGCRHPASGASAWLRRRQATVPARSAPATDARSEPVPLGAVLAEAVPAGGGSSAAAEAPVSPRLQQRRAAVSRPGAAPMSGSAASRRPPPREAGRARSPATEAYRQDLRAIYQAVRDRAWPGPESTGRTPRSRRPTTTVLPPATGPPRPDLPAIPVAV